MRSKVPKGPKGEKRPRDPNQLAKLIVDIATGQVEDRGRTPEEQGKTAAAVARGKAGGIKGGHARAMKLSPEQRAEIARIAAQTRWKKSPD
jgi:hypothetical protein